MKVGQDHDYKHSTESLYALFTDANEVEAKLEGIGGRNIRIDECETDDDGAFVSYVREMPMEVPGILSKFLQPWNTVGQSEQWRDCGDSVYEADLDFDIPGVPVTITGTLGLEPADDGCINHVQVTVTCGIPFVGKALAEFVANDCLRVMGDEFEYLTDRLDSA